jgi:hypothetical protein
VTWSITDSEGEPRFRFLWHESDGPPVRSPIRKGFGRTLLEASVPGATDATPILNFAADGFIYEFEVPLANIVATDARPECVNTPPPVRRWLPLTAESRIGPPFGGLRSHESRHLARAQSAIGYTLSRLHRSHCHCSQPNSPAPTGAGPSSVSFPYMNWRRTLPNTGRCPSLVAPSSSRGRRTLR